MNQSAFCRWVGLLRKKRPAPAVNEPPPERSVVLLWTGPGLGAGGTETG
ncbi:hypothetical protein [Mycobacterium scrofulaceum]|nr:hypothetical protein [Mycobacterium scrofulaceum]